VRRDVALACRILARQGDLVAFFEHVSHRIAGQDDRFAMSPAKDFAAMEPADIGIIATAGDCAQLEGEIPAAPFRWYHRDLLERRADVNVIVHTHPMYGRAYDVADTVAPPVHRYAAHGMAGVAPPTFPKPSLLFDEADRAEMLELLADGPWVHARAHGTDYCAADIATATVTAIHHEQHLRFHSLATSLGDPTALDRRALELITAHGPAPERWWTAYAEAFAA
jgi:ribulose-5-phosphate 4-epimerase/fuculose-1-phosphate aldolase